MPAPTFPFILCSFSRPSGAALSHTDIRSGGRKDNDRVPSDSEAQNALEVSARTFTSLNPSFDALLSPYVLPVLALLKLSSRASHRNGGR